MARKRQRANGDGDVWVIARDEAGNPTRYGGSFWVDSPSGDKERIYATAKTARECRKRLAEKKAEAAKNGGVLSKDGNITLGRYLQEWLESPKMRSRKESTISQYRRQMEKHILPDRIATIKLGKLRAHDIQDFYNRKAKEVGAATINQFHHVLHGALQSAYMQELILSNPASRTEHEKPKAAKMQPLDGEQVKALFAAARGDRLEALFMMAVYGGFRIGEILALRWSDVDMEKGVIRVQHTMSRKGKLTPPKSGKGREVHLASAALEALKSHRARQAEERLHAGSVWVETGHVFTSATAPGEYLREVTVSRAFKRLLKEASLPNIRFHDLRHTCATLLFSQGANPKVVQEMLGHSSVAITMDRYTHWIPSMGEQAAKMLEVALS
jgi:integrase